MSHPAENRWGGGLGTGWLDGWEIEGKTKNRRKTDLLTLTPVGWASLSSVEWTGNGVCPVQSEWPLGSRGCHISAQLSAEQNTGGC